MVSNATLTGLAVAVLLTVGAIIVAERMAPGNDAAARQRLLRQDIDTFDSFEYHRGTFEITCLRRHDDGQWDIEKPLAARADAEFIRRFLDGVSSAAILENLRPETLRRRGVSPENLGLGVGSPRLTLSRADGSSATIAFGTNTVDGRLHIKMSDMPGHPILAVDKSLFDLLPAADLSAFRDRRLLPFSEERLRQVELRSGSQVVAFERDASGAGWTLRQPVEAPASVPDVAALARFFLSLRADIEPGTSSAADIEAESSARHCTPEDATAIARFWFSAADPSAPPRYGQLLFGDREGVRVYLYSTEEKFLATVDASVLDAIAVDPEKLRDHALFPGRHPGDIARLRIAPAGESALVFARDAKSGAWSLNQPVPHSVRAEALDTFATGLLALKDDGLAPTNLPSSDPAVQIEFEFLGGESVTSSVARVAIPAPADPAAASSDSATEKPSGAVPDGGSVWTLPSGPGRLVAPGALSIAPWDATALHGLLDPVILTVADAAGATFRLQSGSSTPRLLRDKEAAALRSLLSPLAALRVEAVAPLSVEPYGLLEPVASLTITPPEGAPAAPGATSSSVLLLGGTAPDGARYTMLRGGYTVYALAPATARMLFGR